MASFEPGSSQPRPQHAACLAGAFESGLNRREACLVCFLRGFSAQERALKSAYADSFQRIQTWIDRVAGPGANTWAAAEAVARLASRRSSAFPNVRAARTRLRSAGKPASMLRDALLNAMNVFLGAPAQLHPDTLVAFGMQGLKAPVTGTDPLASGDDLSLGWMGLPALAAASVPELSRPRGPFETLQVRGRRPRRVPA